MENLFGRIKKGIILYFLSFSSHTHRALGGVELLQPGLRDERSLLLLAPRSSLISSAFLLNRIKPVWATCFLSAEMKSVISSSLIIIRHPSHPVGAHVRRETGFSWAPSGGRTPKTGGLGLNPDALLYIVFELVIKFQIEHVNGLYRRL